MAQVQAQVRAFPGYGIVYPDGVSGIKVVRTFTQGPSKIVNADGSVSFTIPPPTIHELYGGGFSYADGSLVTNREHLEGLPVNMKERALEWFDGNRGLSVVAKEDVPPLNLDEKIRPEPAFILSSELSSSTDEIRKVEEQLIPQSSLNEVSLLDKLVQSITSLTEMVKTQGEEIAKMKMASASPAVRKLGNYSKSSERMKARWADPEFRAKMEGKRKHGNNTAKAN